MVQKQNVVDLFDNEAVEASTNFLEKKSIRTDGLYKPDVKKAIDKTKGYTATIRFLPNLLENGTLGQGVIEKEVYYVSHPDFKGYYDSQKSFSEKCPLNTLQWRLKNSKNVADNERAKMISYTKKFYSYVLIVEDEQQPELVGKILVFPYGFKIKEKIEAEKFGNNVEGEKCNPFDIVKGKDFRLVIKEVGGFPNYDNSIFKTISVLKIWDTEKEKLVPISMSPEGKRKVNEFLLSRSVTLEDNVSKKWSEEQTNNVNQLVDELTSSRQRLDDRPVKGMKEVVDLHDLAGDDPDYDLDADE